MGVVTPISEQVQKTDNIATKNQRVPGAKFHQNLAVILLLIAGFFIGYYISIRGLDIRFTLNPLKVHVDNKLNIATTVDFKQFFDAWTQYTAGKDAEEIKNMYYVSIVGMVASLGDPYTSFLPPVVNKNVTDAINGTYQGIGAELGFRDAQLVVVSPLDGSPAKFAGVRAGDQILAIDGASTVGISLNEAVAKIRGPANTTVELTIKRDTGAAFPIKITRNTITVSSVTWEDKGNGIAYIRVSRFGGDTNKEWSKAVSEINTKMKELDAVIVDVRGNPGGYLQSAVYIAGEFYSNKPVLYEEDALGKQIPDNTNRAGVLNRIPGVFVLIDGGSASASEILAAALRDEYNAKLVGVKSFGKGTVQTAEDFNDGSGLHITIRKWLTPSKEWVHKVGLTPDYEVQRTDDDINKGLDPQLDKAVELAKQL